MNTKLLLAVADWIEQHPEGYDQSRWGFEGTPSYPTVGEEARSVGLDCGTPACVAGWAVRLSAENEEMPEFGDWPGAARRLLGLSEDGAGWLFNSEDSHDIAADGDMPAVLRAIAAGERPWDA